MSKISQEEKNKIWVEKASKVEKHIGKGYQYVGEFINNYTKIEIICPKHGSFFQKPNSHLNGAGCQKCANEKSVKLQSKQVFQYNEYHNLIAKYESAKEASKIINEKFGLYISADNISNSIRKNFNTGGYTWSYKKLEPLKEPIKIRKPEDFWMNKKYHNEAIEYCLDMAKLCKTKTEFIRKFNRAYIFAKENNLLEECYKHTSIFRTSSDRIIYVIFFKNGNKIYFYVGLTNNIKRRIKRHLSTNTNHNTVSKFIKETNLKPYCIQLTDYENEDDASILEGVYQSVFEEEGYININKAKTGGLGGSGLKYSDEELINIAKKYNNAKEWICNDLNTYSVAVRRKILNKCCEHMIPLVKKRNYWKDFNNIKKELLPIIEDLKKFPTHDDLKILKRKDISTGICRHHGGIIIVKQKLGY